MPVFDQSHASLDYDDRSCSMDPASHDEIASCQSMTSYEFPCGRTTMAALQCAPIRHWRLINFEDSDILVLAIWRNRHWDMPTVCSRGRDFTVFHSARSMRISAIRSDSASKVWDGHVWAWIELFSFLASRDWKYNLVVSSLSLSEHFIITTRRFPNTVTVPTNFSTQVRGISCI